MNRFFRRQDPGLSGYAALTLFALAYLSAMALVLAPGSLKTEPAAAISAAATSP
jgi:hypothetical protein